MTPDDLAAIRARAEAATEGPWAWASHTTVDGDEWAVFDPADHALASNRDGWSPDAEFIANARADVPALLAEVERLTRLLGSHADGHRCTCTMLTSGSLSSGPPEWEQDPWCPTHPDVDQIKAEYDQLRAAGPWTQHVEKMRAMKQERDGDCICDHNPETTDGPDEECPWHGRRYSEWIERGDALAAKIARVEEIVADVDTWTPYQTRDIGEAYLADLVQDLLVDGLRAALADPKEDT